MFEIVGRKLFEVNKGDCQIVILNLATCQKNWNSFVTDISKQFFMFQASIEEGGL